ncbi:hypothetical protein ACIA5E_13040 [Nocardia asteroides]|uniref:hypothetical protein n=1 Tax=Nocardia asteroides TaxID=1824 RepID=UPI0037B90AEF
MYTVDLLVVGRGQHVVDAALTYLDSVGVRALGTTTDDQARVVLEREAVRLLVLGGGIEPDSRTALTAAATAQGTTVIQAERRGRDVEQYLAEEVVPVLRT